MCLQHASLAIEDDRIEEFRYLYLIPSFAENNVALKYFVLKCCSEATFRCTLLDMFLDLSSYATNCAYLSTTKFSNFKFAIKHSFDERSVFVDLERLTYQFEFFHYFKV